MFLDLTVTARLGLVLSSAASIFDLYHWLTSGPKRRSSWRFFFLRWAILCILQPLDHSWEANCVLMFPHSNPLPEFCSSMSHNHSEIVFPKFKVERGEKRVAYNGNEFPWQVDMETPGD